jgi:antitoxin (DNA-binding transcriptional repressor) of toxin-antitoxin stability system
MRQITISRFRATCSRVFEGVRKTGKPILVTRFGKPLAVISAPPKPERPRDWVGSMAGTVRIVGDIVSPASDERDWEVLNLDTVARPDSPATK